MSCRRLLTVFLAISEALRSDNPTLNMKDAVAKRLNEMHTENDASYRLKWEADLKDLTETLDCFVESLEAVISHKSKDY